MKTELTTVPSFIFPNGDEQPLFVAYYNGSIEITQSHYGEDEMQSIQLSPDFVKDLLKEILRHRPEAEKLLNKKL